MNGMVTPKLFGINFENCLLAIYNWKNKEKSCRNDWVKVLNRVTTISHSFSLISQTLAHYLELVSVDLFPYWVVNISELIPNPTQAAVWKIISDSNPIDTLTNLIPNGSGLCEFHINPTHPYKQALDLIWKKQNSPLGSSSIFCFSTKSDV